MKGGDISNDAGQVLGIDVSLVFDLVPQTWVDRKLTRWTKGRWALLAPVVRFVPLSQRVIRALSEQYNIHYFVFGIPGMVSERTVEGILDKHSMPVQAVHIVDPDYSNLRDVIAENDVKVFTSKDTMAVYHAGSRGQLFLTWDSFTVGHG